MPAWQECSQLPDRQGQQIHAQRFTCKHKPLAKETGVGIQGFNRNAFCSCQKTPMCSRKNLHILKFSLHTSQTTLSMCHIALACYTLCNGIAIITDEIKSELGSFWQACRLSHVIHVGLSRTTFQWHTNLGKWTEFPNSEANLQCVNCRPVNALEWMQQTFA